MHARGLVTTFGFLVVPALASFAPLLVIPAVTGRHGAEGWAAVAIGLALGGTVAVIADLGWSVVGPQEVARQPRSAQSRYADALASRCVAFVVAGPPAVCLALLISSTSAITVAMTTIGAGLAGLSPAWFLVGLGRPWLLAGVETVPKVLASATVAAAIAAGAPLWWYGAVLSASAFLTLLLCHVLRIGRLPSPTEFRNAGRTVVRMRVLALGRAVSTAGTVLPAAVLGVTSPALVAGFAAIDRPTRMGLQVLQAIPSRMQSWLGGADDEARPRRLRAVLLTNAVVGLAAGAILVLVGPLALPVLFSDTVSVEPDALLAAGVLVVVVCVSRALGLGAVAAGRAGATTYAAIVIAICGASGVALGGWSGGVPGAIWGLVIAETAGCVVQTRLRPLRRTTPPDIDT